MSHHTSSAAKKRHSRWEQFLVRLIFVAFGLFLILVGEVALHRHHFAWTNWYGQTIFAPGLIGLGIVFTLFTFVPNGNWFYRRITTRPPILDEELRQSHERHAHHSKTH